MTLALPPPGLRRTTTIETMTSLMIQMAKNGMMSPQLLIWRHDMVPECKKASALKNLAAMTIPIR
jgi:hypothetical protein